MLHSFEAPSTGFIATSREFRVLFCSTFLINNFNPMSSVHLHVKISVAMETFRRKKHVAHASLF
jgi:hypothetical protein